MRVRLFGSILCLGLVVMWLLSSPSVDAQEEKLLNKKAAIKLIQSYFLDADANQEELLSQLSAGSHLLKKKKDISLYTKVAFDALRKSTIRKYTKLYPDFRRSGLKGILTATHPEHKGKYVIVGSPQGRQMGVLFTLHGGGTKTSNDSSWEGMRGQYSISKGFSINPRVLTDTGVGWNTPANVEWLESVIRDMCAMYDIDTNRIYCTGYSLGGAGSFYYGTLCADRFAAIAPNANGHTLTCSFENLYHTPMQIHIGDGDTTGDRIGRCREVRDIVTKLHDTYPDGYVLKYAEHAGMGHQVPTGDVPKFLQQFKRDPNPKKIIWYPLDIHFEKTTFYWIECESPYKARLELELKENTVTIVQNDMGDLTLYFNESMVDFETPLQILAEDKDPVTFTLKHDLGTLVKTVGMHIDRHRVYTSSITISR